MHTRYFDEDALGAVKKSINRAVPWYLMACYAYYHEDNPILLDATFDLIAKEMVARWDEITHPHKATLTREMVSAQTFLGSSYPSMAVQALNALRINGITEPSPLHYYQQQLADIVRLQ